MKTHPTQSGRSWGGERISVLSATCFAASWLALVVWLPWLAIAAQIVTIFWLMKLRAENIRTVAAMRGGKLPLVVNRNWPLLGACLSIAWLLVVSLAMAVAASLRAADLLPSPALDGPRDYLALAAALALAASVMVPPFFVLGAARAIRRETETWKNSGPRSDPPSASFGPFPPTGLSPAPLAAAAEPVCA